MGCVRFFGEVGSIWRGGSFSRRVPLLMHFERRWWVSGAFVGDQLDTPADASNGSVPIGQSFLVFRVWLISRELEDECDEDLGVR